MNYRHAFHAGNFADVMKHVVLTGTLLHLRKKEKPFRAIDTHGGRGLYDLAGDEAARTGEAGEGIGRLADLAEAPLPPALAAYLGIVRGFGASGYPGSPLIIAKLLRQTDRLIAIERHPEDFETLERTLSPYRNAKAVYADGYARLPALLPPSERRGVVLIDPPYEADDEFDRVAEIVAVARRRFATGIYLVWYPLKSRAAGEALTGELRAGGTGEVLRITIDVGTASPDGRERLTAAGLLIVNPPHGLDREVRAAAALLAPRLGREAPARITLESL